MSEYLPQIIGAVLIPLFGIIGTLLGKLLVRMLDKIQNEHLQGMANVLVRWASQKLTGGNRGREKFRLVASKISKKFKWAKQEQIEEAIEAVVNNLRREAGNAEGSATTS